MHSRNLKNTLFYFIINDDHLHYLTEFIADVARKTGIILDPVYSGKAAFHLVKCLNTKPEIFKGKKIVFVHTGSYCFFVFLLSYLIAERSLAHKV